ncbi:hypothetical protein [Roseateles sp. MS654]|uniref:hypothetical protein n=1 Tax=Roseateles sp. MS654 TaxID=3412685 RepID=UPI003C2E34B8
MDRLRSPLRVIALTLAGLLSLPALTGCSTLAHAAMGNGHCVIVMNSGPQAIDQVELGYDMAGFDGVRIGPNGGMSPQQRSMVFPHMAILRWTDQARTRRVAAIPVERLASLANWPKAMVLKVDGARLTLLSSPGCQQPGEGSVLYSQRY